MNSTTKSALRKADEVRRHCGAGIFQPVNVFDICQRLEVDVRFVDINMEGVYVATPKNPCILISAFRPMPRRCFTCAHELGHHIFEHGSKLDIKIEDLEEFSNEGEEKLVDIFAGALLMPVVGVLSQFAKRGWNIKNATPIQFFTVASAFGTGYSTLVTHCAVNNLINWSYSEQLLKTKPAMIFQECFGSSANNSHFKIIDEHSKLTVIDLEISNYIILPKNCEVQGEHLRKSGVVKDGESFVALKPGIIRVFNENLGISAFVRIQKEEYIGLSENRHLEN